MMMDPSPEFLILLVMARAYKPWGGMQGSTLSVPTCRDPVLGDLPAASFGHISMPCFALCLAVLLPLARLSHLRQRPLPFYSLSLLPIFFVSFFGLPR